MGGCNGRPKRGNGYGGAWGQHRKMLDGRHPRTNEELPPPKRHDGTAWEPGKGKYLNLKVTRDVETDDKFYRYEPEVFDALRPAGSDEAGKFAEGEPVFGECGDMATSPPRTLEQAAENVASVFGECGGMEKPPLRTLYEPEVPGALRPAVASVVAKRLRKRC